MVANSCGGEGGLVHDAADGQVVEDGENERLELDLDGAVRPWVIRASASPARA